MLLKALNSKRTGYRAGWIEGYCPAAPWNHGGGKDTHPSFGIKSETAKPSICKCWSCGFGGDLMDILFKLRQLQKKEPHPGYDMPLAAQLISNEFEEMELVPESIPEYDGVSHHQSQELVFPEWWLASFKSAQMFPEAMEYLKSRFVSKKMVADFDIRFDPIQRRVGFPYRNYSGKLMGLQGRAIDKSEELRYFQYGYKAHRNGHVWMNESRLDLDQPVVLLEGPLDLTSVYRAYPNVAASFTSGLSVEKMKRMADASEIITLYDYGAGGAAARKRISEFFKKIPVTHLIPTPDQDDAGNMSLEEICGILEDHVQLELFD